MNGASLAQAGQVMAHQGPARRGAARLPFFSVRRGSSGPGRASHGVTRPGRAGHGWASLFVASRGTARQGRAGLVPARHVRVRLGRAPQVKASLFMARPVPARSGRAGTGPGWASLGLARLPSQVGSRRVWARRWLDGTWPGLAPLRQAA